MNAFWQAMAFLTRIPVPPVSFTENDWKKSPNYYPVVGLVIGILLACTAFLTQGSLPPLLAAALIVSAWVWMTGALHLDGWIDLFDALGSSRSREQMLAIMKDSRVGAMGVVSAVLLLLVKTSAVYELTADLFVLLFAPVTARWMLLVVMRFWPYVSACGMGTSLVGQSRMTPILVYAAILLIFAWLTTGWTGGLSLVFSICLSILFARFVAKKIGGFTGDGYGAIVEFTETAVLVCYLFFSR